MVGGLLEYKGDLPLWGPACGELARGFSGPWSRSGCCPRCSLQGRVLVPTDLIKKMNNGDLPVPQGYSLPRYLAPSPPVTTVLLPTSMRELEKRPRRSWSWLRWWECCWCRCWCSGWRGLQWVTLSGCTSLLIVILLLVSALDCAGNFDGRVCVYNEIMGNIEWEWKQLWWWISTNHSKRKSVSHPLGLENKSTLIFCSRGVWYVTITSLRFCQQLVLTIIINIRLIIMNLTIYIVMALLTSIGLCHELSY